MLRHLWVGACILVGASLMLVLAGCGKQPIAVVGQTKITRDEFAARMEDEAGRDVLINMINQRLIEDAATAAGVVVKPEDVQAEIAKAKEQAGSDEQFAKLLAAQGIKEQDLVDRVTYSLKARALLTKDVKVDEAGLQAFYKQYETQFAQPATVKYSEIVVATKADADKVLAELAKAGADFGTLAKQHSVSPLSRDRNGAVGPVPMQAVAPAAVQGALAKLKPGEVSGVIEADKRLYILKLDELKPAQKADFNRDRKKVEDIYKMQQAKNPQALLQELQAKAQVNVVDPRYQDINDMFKPKGELPTFGEDAPAPDGAAPSPAAPDSSK